MSAAQRRYPIRYHDEFRGAYQAAPLKLARDKSLGHPARSVALFLWSHADGYRVSQRSIAADVGLSINTAKDALKRLQGAGWLVRQPLAKTAGADPYGHIYHLTRRESGFSADDVARLSEPLIRRMSEGDGSANDTVTVSGTDTHAGSANDTQRSPSQEVKEEPKGRPRRRFQEVGGAVVPDEVPAHFARQGLTQATWDVVRERGLVTRGLQGCVDRGRHQARDLNRWVIGWAEKQRSFAPTAPRRTFQEV